MTPLRVTNVITGLEVGGAEVIMQRLLQGVDRDRFAPSVISLTGRGALAEGIEAAGASVEGLALRSVPGPIGVAKLLGALRRSGPDVIQTWLLHANILAGGLGRAARIAPVAWSMHMIAAERSTYPRSTIALQSIEARLSGRVPARIIACSAGTYDLLRTGGYSLAHAELVPNGFDTEALKPDTEAGSELRRELEIGEDTPLVAHVARLHPTKDHRGLLEAAALVREEMPGVAFVLCGAGVDPTSAELAAWARPLGASVHLLGPRPDVPRIFQAADVAVLSSASEAMPLVIGEAMACGTPVVATDRGDSPELIGETGRVVPARNPRALADGLLDLLRLPPGERAGLGRAARQRIAQRFSMRAMVDSYERAWSELAAGSGG